MGPRPDLNFGRLNYGLVAGERDHGRDRLEALIDQIQAPAIVCVVELADRFFSRLLQFLERGPLEEELAGERGKEILTGQGEGLGIVALEGVAQHVGEEGAQVDRGAALFQEAGEGACLRILWPPRREFVAVLAEQLEADLGIGRIALGPAGFKSLAVACGGGWVDRVEHEEGISHEGGDEGAFGLLQAEGDLPKWGSVWPARAPIARSLQGYAQGSKFHTRRSHNRRDRGRVPGSPSPVR